MKIKHKYVFVSTPYTGNTELNTEFARQACLYTISCGCTPIAPHLIYPGIIPDENPGWRAVGISMGCDWLALCDELWACGPSITAGMRIEIDFANDLAIPVKYLASEDILIGSGELAETALAVQKRLRGL